MNKNEEKEMDNIYEVLSVLIEQTQKTSETFTRNNKIMSDTYIQTTNTMCELLEKINRRDSRNFIIVSILFSIGSLGVFAFILIMYLF